MAESSSSEVASSRNPFASARFTHWWLTALLVGTGMGSRLVTVPLFIRDQVEPSSRGMAIASAQIALTLPGVFLSLLGGAVADRVARWRILVATYAVGTCVAAVYLLMSAQGVGAVWPVFILEAIVGSAGSFTVPARLSIINQLVSREQLQNGVILATVGFMTALQLLGPLLGGGLKDSQGLTVAFAAEVALLGTGVLLFSRVRTQPPPPREHHILADLLAGLRYLRRERTLVDLLLLSALPNLFLIGPFAVTVPLFIPDVLGASDKWVGIFWSCFGAGTLLGSIALTIRPLRRRGQAICGAYVVGGLLLMLYASSRHVLLAAGILFVLGGVSAIVNYIVALMQEHAAPEMLGRVMSM